jgi:hypothetical protein
LDPNLYHLDWDRLAEVLATVVVLACFIERALSLIFENRLYLDHLGDRPIKELVAFAVALAVCVRWNFDAISMTVLTARTSRLGEILTAGVIAGGSKASIKLFRDILGFRSSAYAEREVAKQRRAKSPASPAVPAPGAGS